MTEKLNTQHQDGEEIEKFDDMWALHANDGKVLNKIPADAEPINKKAVGKGENIKEVKDKIIAFRGINALKAVFTPEDDKLAKAA